MAIYKEMPPLSENSQWGSLTGVRPAKLMTRLIREGKTRAEAEALMESWGVSPERVSLCRDASLAAAKVAASLSPRDVSLYVGIPFCPTRCSYCSFVTHSVKQAGALLEPFLDTLDREISCAGEVIKDAGLNIKSIYMGGGTPTTLSAPQLERVFAALHRSFELDKAEEFTVEAGRPDTIDADKLGVIKAAGAERISINPQTFVPSVMEAIGRSHSVEKVYEAYSLARKAGFGSINMDLIAGLPGDTEEGFRRSLDCAVELEPENITVHTLAVKRGSRLNLEGGQLPGAESVGRMLDYAAAVLRENGYSPYYLYRQKRTAGGFENVGWTKPGHMGIYNVCIMEELHGILSLGGGGVTKMVNPKTGFITRSYNPKYPYEYNKEWEKIKKSKDDFADFYREAAADL